MKTKTIPVTIAFFKLNSNNNKYGKLIGWWTKSKYSHVEIILGDIWVSSVENKGVHIKPLKPLDNTHWDYHELGDIVLTGKQYDILMDWLATIEGKPYDWKGIILTQIFPLRFQSKDKWFCSELVTKILQLLLVKKTLDLEPHLVSPGDLAKLFNIE